MEQGYISLFRSIKSNWIWNDAEKFKWWVDILLTVNHSDAKINIGFDLFECKRGQSIKSLSNWAKEWKVGKDTVRNFFKLLEKDNMIICENLKKTTRITVCKYDSYQLNLHARQTTSKRQANDKQTQAYTNNNDNNDNKNNKQLENKFSFDLSFIPNKESQELILQWLDYKKSKNQKYKSQKSIEVLYNTLKKLSNKDFETAKSIVENSIANNYSGLYAIK